MRYTFIPDEARSLAKAIIKNLKKRKYKIFTDKPINSEAPYITTITATYSGKTLLIEAQGTFNYSSALIDFVRWLSSTRCHCEFFIAIPEASNVSAGELKLIADDGVGLYIVNSKGILHENKKGKNYALQVNSEPTLSYGQYNKEVMNSIQKFNKGERKDALRDICEMVERLIYKIASKAVQKKYLNIDQKRIDEMTWFDQVNTLASPKQYASGRTPIISAVLKDDLQAFRNARNLVDHKVKNKIDDIKRQRQFPDRMQAGLRHISELQALFRKI